MTVEMLGSPPIEDREGRTRTNWFVVVIVGLIVAAAGVGGGYLLFAQDSDSGTNDEVEALLDNFYVAVNAGDIEALQEMSTEDATVLGVPVESGNLLSRSIENTLIQTGGIERIDDPVVAEGGWRFRVAQLTSSTGNSADDDQILMITMVDNGSVTLGGDGTEQDLKITSVDPYLF
jgi:hypothetical protein